MYATWVGACPTHPRTHSHIRHAPAGAGLTARLWVPSLHRPRSRHLLLHPHCGTGALSASLRSPAPRRPPILQGQAEATSFPGPLPIAEREAEGGARPAAASPLGTGAPPPLLPRPSAAAARLVARVSVGSPERVARCALLCVRPGGRPAAAVAVAADPPSEPRRGA
nr:translation initiation factor IF-2-like [Macaca fascicularis]XP_045252872.1 translation initiation factor IF-2-like [Macaca fascicularis]